jgi:glycosyltransferase involved in cell wall biosynthesis
MLRHLLARVEQGSADTDLKVAFDQQVFLLQEYGGISRYIYSLAKHLSPMLDVDVKVIAPLHFNHHLAAFPNGLVWGLRVPRIPKSFRLVRAASEAIARRAMKAFHPDIVHETYFSESSVAPSGARRIVTVYDMIHERFPSMFSNSHLTTGAKRAATKRADHILCISENTRRDLLELFEIPEHKVSVVHIGFDQLNGVGRLPQSAVTVSQKPYVLFVGSREGYKNFQGLLQAYAISPFLKRNFSIRCFGGGPFRNDEIANFRALGLSDTQISQISGGDAVLANMYKGAAAFVYPSLYEGFGIPLLEAMSLGCPVICSNTSSFPEVAGDACEYFDPQAVESISLAMETVLQSEVKRDELIQKGHVRCASFSWDRCARETLQIYKGLM